MGSCASVPKVEEQTVSKQPTMQNTANGQVISGYNPKISQIDLEKLMRQKNKKQQEQEEYNSGKESPRVNVTTTVRVTHTGDGSKEINEYRVLGKIGQGAFGKVKLVMDVKTEETWAMKITSRSILKKMQRDARGRPIKTDDMDLLLREIAILKQIDHPNVVRLHEVIDDPTSEKLYMIFEYIERGPVMKVHANRTVEVTFDEAQAKKYFRDLLKGLQYLHENRIIHRDIKPENLLVANDGTLKLTDFGVSKMLIDDEDDLLKTNAGTPAFISPEACKSSSYHGKPFDIWCCGITLYIFLYGELPFKGSNIVEMYNAILYKEPKIPKNTSQIVRDLILKLLEKDPEKRITLEDLMVHPWVTNHGLNPLKNVVAKHSVSEKDLSCAIRTGETCKLLDRMALYTTTKIMMNGPLQRARENIKNRNLAASTSSANSEQNKIQQTDNSNQKKDIVTESETETETEITETETTETERTPITTMSHSTPEIFNEPENKKNKPEIALESNESDSEVVMNSSTSTSGSCNMIGTSESLPSPLITNNNRQGSSMKQAKPEPFCGTHPPEQMQDSDETVSDDENTTNEKPKLQPFEKTMVGNITPPSIESPSLPLSSMVDVNQDVSPLVPTEQNTHHHAVYSTA